MTPLVFMDTETTGLSLNDDIWEFAAIRREPDGKEKTYHWFVEHSVKKCKLLPESFLADHERRFPASHDGKWHPDVIAPWVLSQYVLEIMAGKPHIVGAVPNFDTERVALLVQREHQATPDWHYHLIDVESLAVGYIHGEYGTADEAERQAVTLPWKSDDLSRACGVEPPGDGERHTALGDARWAMRLYDAITNGANK